MGENEKIEVEIAVKDENRTKERLTEIAERTLDILGVEDPDEK